MRMRSRVPSIDVVQTLLLYYVTFRYGNVDACVVEARIGGSWIDIVEAYRFPDTKYFLQRKTSCVLSPMFSRPDHTDDS